MSDSHLDQVFSDGEFRLFGEAWTRQFVIAINSALGEQVELREDDGAASTPLNYWFHQTFHPLAGSISVGLEREAVISVGAGLLRAASINHESAERAIQSFAEVLGQAAAGMALELSDRYNCEVRGEGLTQSDQGPPLARYSSQFRLVAGTGSYPVSVVAAGRELPQLLESDPAFPTTAPANAIVASTALDPLAVNTRNLDLLLDVELPISVSFGRAQLLLKDVIKLTTGSIVELNRSVSEPVDIIVNNCTIARGEVVVVEGNFGVRIKQIVSKQERLRSVT